MAPDCPLRGLCILAAPVRLALRAGLSNHVDSRLPRRLGPSNPASGTVSRARSLRARVSSRPISSLGPFPLTPPRRRRWWAGLDCPLRGLCFLAAPVRLALRAGQSNHLDSRPPGRLGPSNPASDRSPVRDPFAPGSHPARSLPSALSLFTLTPPRRRRWWAGLDCPLRALCILAAPVRLALRAGQSNHVDSRLPRRLGPSNPASGTVSRARSLRARVSSRPISSLGPFPLTPPRRRRWWAGLDCPLRGLCFLAAPVRLALRAGQSNHLDSRPPGRLAPSDPASDRSPVRDPFTPGSHPVRSLPSALFPFPLTPPRRRRWWAGLDSNQ
jgi:hypothetical protein